MEFSIKSGSPEKQRSACIVIGVFEPRKLTAPGELVDQASKGYLSDIIRRGDMEGKAGRTLLLHNVPGLLGDRVLLVGLGREKDFREREYRESIRAAVTTLNETGAFDGAVYLTEVPVKKRDAGWRVRQAALVAQDAVYRYDQTKSKKDEVRRPLRKLTLTVERRNELHLAERAAAEGQAIAHGMALAKDLGNLPGNICTPTYLAERAVAMCKEYGLECKVLDRKDCEELKMGSFLSVAAGSRQPPKFIIMEHKGGKPEDKPIVLVGKGITFDTGGISIKGGEGMDEMKFDMCGGASVIATMQVAADLKLPLNIVGLVPATENMPDGMATKPGDIVTSMSGQTIEVLNTDAEGRLILCDALTYAERYEPACVVDVATLTGACVIALGHVAAGLYSNNDTLAKELFHAGEDAYDRAWHMPLWDEYQEQLKSNFADMANIGGRPAGSVTAACFLSRYARKYDWAHLDIAGVAWKSGAAKGSTGRPVPLLTQFLLGRVN
ncbi:MAG: leucyl aminopeptidase [Betaproteobacteria bacterium]|nr:leucyl aminopeptidase [Betaproteobacteria bacterium]